MKKNLKKNQKGFSMFELLIYLAIVIGLTVVVYNLTTSARASAEANNVKQELDLFSVGAQNCFTRDRDMTNCTSAKLQQAAISPLRTNTTECGDTWSLTGNATKTITVNYSVASCNDRDNLGNDMVAILTPRDGFTGVSYTTATSIIQFTLKP